MRVYKKEISGLKMTAYNDSNSEWAVSSKDKDGTNRTQWYDMRKFTMKDAFDLHARVYSEF